MLEKINDCNACVHILRFYQSITSEIYCNTRMGQDASVAYHNSQYIKDLARGLRVLIWDLQRLLRHATLILIN